MAAAKPKPRERAEWHLICVTRKGKVSMLQNLTLTVARETYQHLLPGTQPEKHVPPKCWKDDKPVVLPASQRWEVMCKSEQHNQHGVIMRCDDARGDRLDRVDVVGPKGVELNPWAEVKEPVIEHLCVCHLPRVEYRANNDGGIEKITLPPLLSAQPPAEPRAARWDSKRADFWNNPRLWDRIKDPFKQMCWETAR